MTLRSRLVFHLQLLPLPWHSLGESGYIFSIVPQMPHGQLKNGTAILTKHEDTHQIKYITMSPDDQLPCSEINVVSWKLTVDVCFT